MNDRPAHDGFGDEVVAALRGLRPEFREAVELVDVRDLSYQDAADQLACPVGTVMSRLSRAREKLRLAMDDNMKPRLRSVK